MRVAILTPSITSGDAVSNDVLGMYDALRQAGKVRIFAEGWTLNQPSVFPSYKIKSFLKDSNDILIYHFSRGWEPALELLSTLRCRKVIKYHNITPPEFLAKYNRYFAGICQEGREQIKPIARSTCDLFLSDSAYNMRELVCAGAPQSKSVVVSPFHHIDRLHAIDARAEPLSEDRNGCVNICAVGRVVPNKGHLALIQAFAAYYHDYNRNSRLTIVGKEETRLNKYSWVLRELMRKLGVESAVSFAGEVSDTELKAYYHRANVFVTTSEHEGFCVPLIEAMAMRIPIVAYASSAIPETVGPAGIVWDERNPYLLAESINAIVSDDALSEGLGELGWQRYQQHFTNSQILKTFLRVMEQVL
jgi:glycosyltransferase involved in cell wall biosynthesis